MIKRNITRVGLLALLMVFMTSCEKWIDLDINTDPNNPEDVPMKLLLPSAQVNLAYQMGGDFTYASSMWVQQISGVSRQALAFERYHFTEADIQNVWRWGLYSMSLMNFKVIMDKADEQNSPHYGGVAKVLMAYSIGTMSDVWNAMPYSEAFQGADNYTPTYDSQQSIYNSVFSLLNSAITDLQSTSNEISLEGDLIFGNDVDQWTKIAYGLKARYNLHLANISGDFTDVITSLEDAENAGFAMSSIDDDMILNFGLTALESHPLFQFIEQRDDIRMGEVYVDMLVNNGDPRTPQLVAQDDNGDYVGAAAGSGTVGASSFGPYFSQRNSPVIFFSYAELKFIEAEAKLASSGAGSAYNDAVMASLERYGVAGDSTTFEANFANETDASITLDKIMKQKYTHLFLHPEAFVDWRRNNIPALSLAQNASKNIIPRRYPYPTSEKSYNGANVPSVLITDKVWWDQ